MKLALPQYVVAYHRKNGAVKYYFRVPPHVRPKGWRGTYRLNDDIVEMFRQAENLNKRLKAERTTGAPLAAHTKGSIPWLLERYHQSKRYKDLATSTKDLFGYCAKEVLKWSKKSGHPHVKLIKRPIIVKFLEKFDETPSKKKNVATFLRCLLKFAYDIGELEANPALKMGIKNPEAQVHIWTDEEITTIIKKADEMGLTSVGTAVLLASEIGQRQGDVLDFQYGIDYQKDRFMFRQNKTKEFMSLPATLLIKSRLEGRSTGFIIPTKEGEIYSPQLPTTI